MLNIMCNDRHMNINPRTRKSDYETFTNTIEYIAHPFRTWFHYMKYHIIELYLSEKSIGNCGIIEVTEKILFQLNIAYQIIQVDFFKFRYLV